MDEELINLIERGVHLPTGGQWVDVPGTPLQVMCRWEDLVGTFWMRANPDIQPNHWTSWSFMIPDDIEGRG